MTRAANSKSASSRGIFSADTGVPVELRHDDSRMAVVRPTEQHNLLWPLSQVVSACGTHAMVESFCRSYLDRWKAVESFLASWCSHRSPIVKAMIGPHDGGQFLVLLLVDNDEPDAKLGDDVADLSIELFRQFPEIPLSIMTIPSSQQDTVESLVDLDKASTLYAIQSGSR